MGEVYSARDTREATAVSSLTHPHICTIHDVGHEAVGGDDLHYLMLSPLRLETVPATTVFLNWTAGLRWLQACRP